jgi:hypothetical protein
MEDVLVPWGGRVKFPVFEFRAMFQSLIDDPRLCKELLINWSNPSSIPPYDKTTLMRFIPLNGIMIHTSSTTFRMARL